MKFNTDITQEYLKSILDYDPETGIFKHKVRPEYMFKTLKASKTWNSRFSGKVINAKNNCGYYIVGINYKLYLCHRLAWLYMTGAWPEYEVDHINMNRSDNRFCNLRSVYRNENLFNKRPQSNNTSGFKGVHYNKEKKLYQANIQNFGNSKHLGYFSTPEEAHEAYKQAALRLHGEYARF